ncbi:unnamed protein product [Acidithrix sp. C25]|nr:unnamed protein product [Acidithrix sp. C25]
MLKRITIWVVSGSYSAYLIAIVRSLNHINKWDFDWAYLARLIC